MNCNYSKHQVSSQNQLDQGHSKIYTTYISSILTLNGLITLWTVRNGITATSSYQLICARLAEAVTARPHLHRLFKKQLAFETGVSLKLSSVPEDSPRNFTSWHVFLRST